MSKPTLSFFDCEECGQIHEALFDGYFFGDRLLEGVMFKAKIENGDMTISMNDSNDDAYMNSLNKEQWLKTAKQFALKNDIFECPYCGEDVVPNTML